MMNEMKSALKDKGLDNLQDLKNIVFDFFTPSRSELHNYIDFT